jgi:RND family efflux transporter MFP subunit
MTSNHRLLVAAPLALAGLFMTGCQKPATPAALDALPPATVRTVRAEWRTLPAHEEVVGSVQSRQRAEIEAKVNARIERLPVAPGQRVAKDELLVQLDDREIRARLLQAEATLDQAQKDLKRFTELRNNNTITEAEFDQVQSRARVAEAVKIEAETLLGYTRVQAPFDGVITRKLAEVGDLGTPGRPLLVLEDPEALRFEADVPETLMERVTPGAKMAVTVSGHSQPVTGSVVEVAPAADPVSRTFRVKLDLPATEGLRLGQFGRVAVPVKESRVLRVPASAVLVRGQMELVFVVQDGQARLRLVKTGKRFEEEVEIVSGVNDGDMVVAGDLTQLLDGQPVTVR